jgi:hypothetical protein
MDPSTYVGLYTVILIFIFMVWYAGYEGTMRVFQYLDLQLRYVVIRVQMRILKRKLEKQLGVPHKNYDKFLEDYPNE